jgi:hypothetical protein
MSIRMQGIPSVEMLTTALGQLDELLRQPRAAGLGLIAGELDRLEELAGALPLTTDEYCFAVNGIAGARGYWAAGEVGAARYQLGMVRGKLARLQPGSPPARYRPPDAPGVELDGTRW